ncbi:Uma2 family endonuclease [Thermoleptolyngbya oregonensis NK1-22]|uniref:Uma2 family endonuclease n=1 Tax=Thermoleptolyngbya oregonensis NK1-22 TaxID=2547457 RepID=A0AA97B993_9CYAN|nr:Uma2 family endonuclease [Thermoleptolyngbya oregonensis]WOB42070.1 Uma2 family endonuclease [Thermoleptolyngbya oregonensis NK1-22]
MTALLPTAPPAEIFYPSSDGEPVAETYVHLYAMLVTLEVLRQYLEGQQATVLSNQFLYYAQGYPRLRVAPDVMVIFDVAPGGRDHYKLWEEGQVPAVIFEMTSKSTQAQDQVFKRTLYEQLGVREYWLFDPRGEWIDGQLQGYRLHNDTYEPITDGRSDPLKLRLEVDGHLIAFYREDTGEKLLIPGELAQALRTEAQARQDAEARAAESELRAQALEAEVERLRSRLRELGAEDS